MGMRIGDKIGNWNGTSMNGKQPVWEWKWPLFPWESIPIDGYSVTLFLHVYVIVQFCEGRRHGRFLEGESGQSRSSCPLRTSVFIGQRTRV